MSVSDRSAPTTTLTIEQFLELPDEPGVLLELLDECVTRAPTAGARHNEIAFYIALLIYQFARQHALEWAGSDGTGYVIPGEQDTVLIPDTSFVARERIPEGGTPSGFWPFPPDLAVEVVSPHDRAIDVHNKAWRYLDAGTRSVWVIYPDRSHIQVFADGKFVAEIAAADTLDGGNVLPGFAVSVAEIFKSSAQGR